MGPVLFGLLVSARGGPAGGVLGGVFFGLKQFLFSWLFAFMFFFTISMGALFWIDAPLRGGCRMERRDPAHPGDDGKLVYVIIWIAFIPFR